MNDQELICPMCEEGHLSPIRYVDTFEHRSQGLRVEGLEAYQCDTCGADPVFEDQIRRNHRRVVDAKRVADGLLSGDQIQALREALGITQREAAVLFGGGANAFSKYERGDVVQSAAMDRLLKLVFRYRFLLDELRREAGVEVHLSEATIGAYETVERVRLSSRALRIAETEGHRVKVEVTDWHPDGKRAA